jgi:hypothetical protein
MITKMLLEDYCIESIAHDAGTDRASSERGTWLTGLVSAWKRTELSQSCSGGTQPGPSRAQRCHTVGYGGPPGGLRCMLRSRQSPGVQLPTRSWSERVFGAGQLVRIKAQSFFDDSVRRHRHRWHTPSLSLDIHHTCQVRILLAERTSTSSHTTCIPIACRPCLLSTCLDGC